MYPYTKELTLDEARNLHKEIPNLIVCANEGSPFNFVAFYIIDHYNSGGRLYCTAFDYATHLLKKQTPPEGWGYAAYNEPEKYKTLDFAARATSDYWQLNKIAFNGHWVNCYNYAFKLTDLARVEAESETAPIEASTDWEDKYNQEKSECTRLRKVLFDTEAKYNKVILQEKDLQDQADQYKSDFEFAIKHNQSLTDNHYMELYNLRAENDKLKNYIINQLLNN